MQPVRRQCSIPLTTYRTSLGATGVVRRDGKTRSQWSPLPTYCCGEEGGVLPERDWKTATLMNLPSYVRLMLPTMAKNLLAKCTVPITDQVIRTRLKNGFPSAYEAHSDDMVRMFNTELKRLQKPKQTKREKRIKKKDKRISQVKHAYMAHAEKLWTPDLSIMPYPAFLETPYWKIIRQLKLIDADHRCSKCCSNEQLQIHHINYENRGREHLFLWQLKVLCRGCHKHHHHIK